jgi:hypothetical protein
MAFDHVGMHTGTWYTIPGSTHMHETEGKPKNAVVMMYVLYAILGTYCTRCILSSVYAVLGKCCTRYMLYPGSTHDNGMERWSGMT